MHLAGVSLLNGVTAGKRAPLEPWGLKARLDQGLSNPAGFGGIPSFEGGFTQGDSESVAPRNQWFPNGISISSQVLGLECWQFKMDYSGAHPGSYRGEYWLTATVGGCVWWYRRSAESGARLPCSNYLLSTAPALGVESRHLQFKGLIFDLSISSIAAYSSGVMCSFVLLRRERWHNLRP